jgi:hypothetical protein
MTNAQIDFIASRLWVSDNDSDPMLCATWQASKEDYRRRAEVAVKALADMRLLEARK